MTILEQIRTIKIEFEKRTGIKPTKLYLGRKTLEDLIKELEPLFIDITDTNKFLTMDVYRVVDEMHIGVGI